MKRESEDFSNRFAILLNWEGKKTKIRRLHYWSVSRRWEKNNISYFIRMYIWTNECCKGENFIFYFHFNIFFIEWWHNFFFSSPFSSHVMHFIFIFIVAVTKNEAFHFFIHFVFFFLYIWMSIPVKMFYILNLSPFIFFAFFLSVWFQARDLHSFTSVEKWTIALNRSATKSSEVCNAIFDVKWILELNITLENFLACSSLQTVCAMLCACYILFKREKSFVFFIPFRSVFLLPLLLTLLSYCVLLLSVFPFRPHSFSPARLISYTRKVDVDCQRKWNVKDTLLDVYKTRHAVESDLHKIDVNNFFSFHPCCYRNIRCSFLCDLEMHFFT